MASKLSAVLKAKVFAEIAKRPGITNRILALKFPQNDVVYGSHRGIASAIAELRKDGLVRDVPRCETCGAAKTRGRKNGPLFLTHKGHTVYSAV